MTKVEGANIIVDRDKKIAASERNTRKAGLLAAGAQALGVANYLNKKTDAPNEQLGLLGQQISAYDKRIAGLKTKQTELESGLTDLSKPTNSSSDTATDSKLKLQFWTNRHQLPVLKVWVTGGPLLE